MHTYPPTTFLSFERSRGDMIDVNMSEVVMIDRGKLKPEGFSFGTIHFKNGAVIEVIFRTL